MMFRQNSGDLSWSPKPFTSCLANLLAANLQTCPVAVGFECLCIPMRLRRSTAEDYELALTYFFFGVITYPAFCNLHVNDSYPSTVVLLHRGFGPQSQERRYRLIAVSLGISEFTQHDTSIFALNFLDHL
jgi:hypothetical protein